MMGKHILWLACIGCLALSGWAQPLPAGRLLVNAPAKGAASGVISGASGVGFMRSSGFYTSVNRAAHVPTRAFNSTLKRMTFRALKTSGMSSLRAGRILQAAAFAGNKRVLGLTLSVSVVRKALPERLGVPSLSEVYALLGREIESVYRDFPEDVVFRGMLIETPSDLLALLEKGMPLSRVIFKKAAVVGQDALFMNNPERELLCFGRSAEESLPYAFGEGIANTPAGGFVVLAVVRKSADMKVKNGVLTLARDVAADEIVEVWTFEPRTLRWYALRGGKSLAEAGVLSRPE